MKRLNDPELHASRARLAAAHIATPSYDRRDLTASLLHIGLGAFARAHVATYAHQLIAAGHHDMGIIGGSLRTANVVDALAPQDGLYTHIEDDGHHTPRLGVIGALCTVTRTAGVIDAIAAPTTTTVTLTVTEKGYCLRPHTAQLDDTHPDIRHDLANPDAPPRSLAGTLVRGLALRRTLDGQPLTVISCDNVPENGVVTRGSVRQFAERLDPALAAWIDANVDFPSSIVDRIVPATTDDDRALVATTLGLVDAAPVRSEAHTMWVIERSDAATRFVAAGATVTDTIAPYQDRKLRLVNALHTAAALLGLAFGHETIADSVTDPAIHAFLATLGVTEIEPTLPPALDPSTPTTTDTLHRFANASLGHWCHQVATDTSQKLGPRILDTCTARTASGHTSPHMAVVVAAWIRHCTASHQRACPLADPLAPQLTAAIEATAATAASGGGQKLVRAMLGVIGAPDAVIDDTPFIADVASRLAEPDLGVR